MGLSTAEKNRRKRERKKREKEERRKQEEAEKQKQEQEKPESSPDDEVEIEYVVDTSIGFPTTSVKQDVSPVVPDGLPPDMNGGESAEKPNGEDIMAVLEKFHQRSAFSAVVSDDDAKQNELNVKMERGLDDEDNDEDDDDKKPMSKRKLRELSRPSVAELKRRVKHPDLVEAHDITAADPEFLIHLKGVKGTVPVPRHWGRKRKYLQGKRGFEKPPFKLPDFIVKTGITEIRDTIAEGEADQSAKQKNRSRVNPKMGAMDVDYKTLYEAFFKHQTKPTGLTAFGNLYYEGKELETSTDRKPGGPLSKKLREALGMVTDASPPPWLINMQRYGPPPSYPEMKIPGLNAPLPNDQCQYGYHAGGWGKPAVDPYNRPLYGGNPFDPPGSSKQNEDDKGDLVTSDGKRIAKAAWGMPAAHFSLLDEESEAESSSEEESSDDDMEESDAEAENEEDAEEESVLPIPAAPTPTVPPADLRKGQAGDETPMQQGQPKQLYQVLEQTANANKQQGVFQSDVKYVVSEGGPSSTAPPGGAESVLSKSVPPVDAVKKRKKQHDEDEDELDSNFKF